MNGAQNWQYEWDWVDRLTKVSSNGVLVLQNWYDARSRRTAKQEAVNGQTKKWEYLFDGVNLVGVMNENAQMRETFTRGVGLAGDIGTLIAVTHHAGSTASGNFYTHHNHRGDVVRTRNGNTTVCTYDYNAFGALKSQMGIDVCRFKFSSKERDASTGFSYYGYRFYCPQWQRWISRDPRGNAREDVHSLLTLRAHKYPYSFCENNPVSRVDSNGDSWHDIWEWIKEKAEALWEALKHIVPGSEFTGPLECGPDMYKILIKQKANEKYDPFDPNSEPPE